MYYGKSEGKLFKAFDILEDPEGGMTFLQNINPDCAKKHGVDFPGIAMYPVYT